MNSLKWRQRSNAKLSAVSFLVSALMALILFQNCSVQVSPDESYLTSTSSVAIQITSYPSNQSIELGQYLSLSLSAYSATGLPLSYQWYKNGVTLAGYNTNTLTIPSASANDTANYFVSISDGQAVINSGGFSIQVGSVSNTISISSGPVAQSVVQGALARFAVAASTSTGTLSFQWTKNGVAISGATGNEFYIFTSTSADTAYYAVDISNGSSTIRSSAVLLSVVATAASCSNLGGSIYGEHCYTVNRSAANWATALATCKSSGGNLAIVSSTSENYFIYTITQTAVWIGATDAATEGNFVWTDGTAMSFSAFAAGEPNGGTSENCIQMTPNGYWNDLSCSESRAFVCEI